MARAGVRGDGMTLLREELRTRLDRLEAGIVARGPIGGRAEAQAIAGIATAYELSAVRRLAEGLSVTLAAGGRGAAIGPWIERLRDALGCDAQDEQAADTWIASVMVRLAY